ncbi:MAG TPA: hypothetical protein VN702_00095 [Acetobacteraceae bacterium]|nr:hypothetical protein [Acetobacteraceae bacterium]
MSHTLSAGAAADTALRAKSVSADVIAALICVALFAIIVYVFQYHGALGESDLYRVLVGLLDGADSHTWLASDLHYDRDFGFGYLAAIYAMADPATLQDPDRLMAVINSIGLWAILPGLVCFWIAVRLIHGALPATVALILFAFSPMMLELATSGHQSLPMFSFLCAAAVSMFWPATGWRAAALGVLAAALLLGGLTMRGEIFLAFPWLVLSRIDTRSFGRFLLSGILRSIPPVAAMVVFFILQRRLIHTAMGSTVGHYFFEFYTWREVPPGIVYMAVGCGFATAVIGFFAGLWLCLKRQLVGRGVYAMQLNELLAPIALVLVPFLFFAPNPMPTRHFMLTLAGLGILIGMVISRALTWRRPAVLAITVGLVFANHVLAELARPPLVRINEAHSPYIPVPEPYRFTTHANLGWFWQRHAALVNRRAQWDAFGEKIKTSCDPHTLIFSDEGEQLFSRLYAGGVPVQAERWQVGPFFGLKGVRQGKTFIILAKMNGWPDDAVAAVLADHALDDYRLAEDPLTMSKYDRTPIPADRAARFGCSAGSQVG